MKKLVLFLSVAVIVLGASTVWLALKLEALQDVPGTARAHSPPATAAPTVAPPIDARAEAGSATRSPTGRALSASAPLSMDPGRLERARSFLTKYHDPVGREQLYQQYLGRARAQYTDLGPMLGLKHDAADRLIGLLVSQELGAEEWGSNCDLDRSCKLADGSQALNDAQQREIAEQFGANTAADLLLYQTSGMERRLITEMRGRLPDGARLSDDKARELMRALAEESRNIDMDISHEDPGVERTNYGAFISAEGDASGRHDAEAAEYNRRLHERAAAVLNTEQLAFYEQMIDAAIEMSHDYRPTP